jgi:hypothetical protein
MKKLFTLLVVTLVRLNLNAQGVGIGTTNPDASAALEVSSVTQGMLVPRMTSEQRNMISSPAQGLLVFDITSNTFWFRHSNGWVELVDSLHSEVHRSGPNSIYMGMNDNVGVGATNPEIKFQVKTGDNAYGMSHTNGTVNVATFVNNQNGGWIGTRSLHPFNLYAGDGPSLLTLLPSGMVGINTPNPLYPLHLTGNSLLNGYVGIGTGANNRLDISHGLPRTEVHPTNRPLYVTGDLGADSDGIEFRHNNSSQGIGFGYNTIYATGSNPDQDLGFNAKGGSGNLLFKTDSIERLRISGAGNVGIHTSNPLHPLHIGGKMLVDDKLGIGTSSINFPLSFSSTTGDKISLWGSSGNHFGFGINPALLLIHTDVANSDIAFGYGSSESFTEQMRIKGNGRLGLGTMTPAQKLHVAGNAYVTDSIGIGISTPAQPLHVHGNAYVSNALGIGVSVPAQQLHVDGNASITQKLGVGLTNPSNTLDLHGSQLPRTGTHASSRPLYVTGDIGADTNGIEFRHLNGTQGIGFGYNTIYAAGHTLSQNLGIKAKGPEGNLLFYTGGNEKMRLDKLGNLGIGIKTPRVPLHFDTIPETKIILNDYGTNPLYFFGFGTRIGDLTYHIPSSGTSHLFLAGSYSAPTELLRIEGNGIVTIPGQLSIGLEYNVSDPVIINGLGSGSVSCNCPSGTSVLGGGYSSDGGSAQATSSYPESNTSWKVWIYNDSFSSTTVNAYTICARMY